MLRILIGRVTTKFDKLFSAMVWSQQEIHTLIKLRQNTNQLYWNILERLRRAYWNNIANRLNNICNSNYVGNQCKRKFNNLVTVYKNIDRYEANDQRRKRIQAYRIFFNELKTRFWEGPPDQHDVAMDTPTITQRRRNVRARRRRKERRGNSENNR
ncbi:unnamed protein product [Rhizophagus irregularis]|uniref:Myb-like domain-containing protein n=4 Tax=Rhizophagus irregularis TaxID=588596 RepID=A0A915ZQ01_9GLOM|nr:unnamed protein product [Rhizophagus irregularis]